MSSLFLLAGRVMIAVIFLSSGLHKVSGFSGAVEAMTQAGVPAPSLMLPLAILCLLLASLSLLAGFRVSIGAGLLSLFLVLATF